MAFDTGRGFTPEHWGDSTWLSQTATEARAPSPRDLAQTVVEAGWLGLSEQAVASRALTYCIARLPTLRLSPDKFLVARICFQDGEWLAEAVDLPLYGSGETMEDAQAMLAREIESLWDDLNRPGRRNARWANVKTLLSRVIVTE